MIEEEEEKEIELGDSATMKLRRSSFADSGRRCEKGRGGRVPLWRDPMVYLA